MFDLLSTLPESWSQVTEGQQMTVSENEDGVYVKGLSCHLVQNEEEALNLLFEVRCIALNERGIILLNFTIKTYVVGTH